MSALGEVTTLTSGSATLTIPAGTRYWYVQNQDVTALKITFPSGSGFGPITLNAASAQGYAGDWVDSVGVPFFGASMVLSSSTSAGQFGSGATPNPATTL